MDVEKNKITFHLENRTDVLEKEIVGTGTRFDPYKPAEYSTPQAVIYAVKELSKGRKGKIWVDFGKGKLQIKQIPNSNPSNTQKI